MAESTAQINLKLKDEATKGLNSITTSFGALKTAIKGLAVGVGAIAGVGTAIGLMAAKGEDLRTMRNLFATLAVNAGSSMDEMVAAMNRGAEGLISQTDLMKGSLRVLANTNLPVTAEAMELVAEASKRLGIATGVGAKEAFERFTSAITTGRTRSLAHLGVLVDQTEEVENLAKATNRSVSEITFAEEQQAIYNAVLRETSAALERAGDFSVGFGGQVDQLKTSIVNFKDELFAFTSAFGDAFIDSFKDATGVQINFGTALKFNAETIANFTRNTLVFLIQGLSTLSTAWAFVAEGVNLFLGPLSVLAGLIVKVGKILTTALLAPIQGIISGFEFLIGIIGKAASALGLGGFGGFLKLSSEFIGGFNEDIDGMIAGIDDVSDGLIGMGMESINNIGSAGDSAREFSGTLDDIAGALSEIDASDIATDMAGVATGTGIAAKNIEAISDDLVNIKENSKKAADAWITAFKGGIGAATRDELVATAKLFASELQTELPNLGILSFEDLKKIVETLKTGVAAAGAAAAAEAEAAAEIARAVSEAAAAKLIEDSEAAADAFLIEFRGGIPALSKEEMIATASAFAEQLGADLPDLGIMTTEDIKSIALALESASDTASRKFAANVEGLVGAIMSGDAKAAVKSLGDFFEGVTVFGFDIGAILNAITAITKEIPKILFQSIKDLLINVIADLPLLVGNIIPDLVIPILKLVPVILQRFVENLPIMIDAIIRSLPELIQALISMTPNLIKVIPSLLTSVLNTWFQEWWAEQKPVLILTLKEAALELIEFFRSGIGELMSDVGKAFDEFIIQPYLDMWRFAFDIATEVFDQTYGRLPEIARQAGELIAGPLDDVVDSFRRVVESIPGAGGDGGGIVGQIRGALGFQQGTPFVPRTMQATVHQGEAIIPAAQNPFAGGAAAGAGGFGGMTVNFNFALPPGTPQDQAEAMIGIFERNERTITDKVRRLFNREG